MIIHDNINSEIEQKIYTSHKFDVNIEMYKSRVHHVAGHASFTTEID